MSRERARKRFKSQLGHTKKSGSLKDPDTHRARAAAQFYQRIKELKTEIMRRISKGEDIAPHKIRLQLKNPGIKMFGI